MRFSRVTAAIVMASLSSPLFAGAEQSVGKLTGASQGTFVSRDGKLIPASVGQSLYAGDRVVTRGQAKAQAAFPGCNVPLAPTSVLSVSSSTCATAPKSFVQDGSSSDEGTGGGSGGGVVLGLGIVAAGLGAYFAFKNDDSKPASP